MLRRTKGFKSKHKFDAICTWYEVKPKIFIINPFDLQRKKIYLTNYKKQVARA